MLKTVVFERKYYLDQLIRAEGTGMIKVVTGIRKIIVVGDRYRSGYNEEGILMVALYDFLHGSSDRLWSNGLFGR